MIKSYPIIILLLFHLFPIASQDIARPLPDEWHGIVKGAAFVDRFLPMPQMPLSDTTIWGAKGVQKRYIDNGIEDNEWSYWGGNVIIGEDSIYHTYICRWREDSEKGHMAWPWSEVVHATAKSPFGPYTPLDVIGKGHNPEVHQLQDGRYFLYVNDAYYLSQSLDGPWERHRFEYDQRERPVFDHLANFTFVKRADGSFIMVSRGGGVWLSQTGLPPYYKVSEKSIYPPFEGKYEDPVIWRTNVQYHLVVNDWLGRIAYYMRSKDGIKWKLDAGEAYVPGIARHTDGTVEEWYKFERIKVLQDDYGRAYLANFAVCDTLKHYDLGGDNHSSKNIVIPMVKGRLISILNDVINTDTKYIRVKVKAENDFNPQKDMDIKSLRFGAAEEVNFGRGCRVYRTEKSGDDLILIFNAEGNGLTAKNFAGKLWGKTKKGDLLFGWCRLPWLNYQQGLLSAKFPELLLNAQNLKINLEVQNFGEIRSKKAVCKLAYRFEGGWKDLAEGVVPPLEPFEKTTLTFHQKKFQKEDVAMVRVSIIDEDDITKTLEGKVVIR